MNQTTLFRGLLVVLLTGVLLAWMMPAAAQDAEQNTGDQPVPAEATQPESEQQAEEDVPSAEQVLQDLLRRRQQNPLIEPAQPTEQATLPTAEPEAAPAAKVGTAPRVPRQTLKREGQFIVTRRGYLTRSTIGATPWMYTFASDGDAMADPPMLLMPCRQLENMERIVEERGTEVAFIVSGQVFVYHNQNYLLPTLVKLAPDRGNLSP